MTSFDLITPNINIHVGTNIRSRRIFLQKSEDELARNLDISTQQLKKLEEGTHQLTVDKLYQISELLNTPIEFFFFGLSHHTKDEMEQSQCSSGGMSPEAYKVYEALSVIENKAIKDTLVDFLLILAKLQKEQEDQLLSYARCTNK